MCFVQLILTKATIKKLKFLQAAARAVAGRGAAQVRRSHIFILYVKLCGNGQKFTPKPARWSY